MTAAATLGQVVIRPGEATDAAFCHSSWLRSHLFNSKWSQLVGECYHHEHSEVIKRLLDRGEVRIAGWSEDPETIIGWCCVEPATVHYVYVRKEFRRRGIARLLLGPQCAPGISYTHRTTDWDRLHWPGERTYNPYPGLR